MLLIGVDTIRVVMKDGRTCVLSFEDKELRDLLSWQVSCSHHCDFTLCVDVPQL